MVVNLHCMKMASVSSSKSHRLLDFLPSIRPSFLSVVLLFACGCLWMKNERILTNSEPASHASHASHHVSHARQMLVPSPFSFLRLLYLARVFGILALISFQYRFVICFYLFQRLLRYVLYCFVVNKF